MGDIEYQCWICPACGDDHLQSLGCSDYIKTLEQTIKRQAEGVDFYADKNNYYASPKTVKYNKLTNFDLEVFCKRVEIGGKLARQIQSETESIVKGIGERKE